MATEFKLPELGESVETGTLVKILVQSGQQVEKDQDVLELETDKAVLQVPSSVSGMVGEILVKEGTTVSVGQPIFTVESGDKSATPQAPTATEQKGPGASANGTDSSTAHANEVRNVEAGQGEDDEIDAAVASARPDPNVKPVSSETGTDPSAASSPNGAAKTMSAAGPTAPVRNDPAPASPSVRRVARELGIDIHQVQGSGPGGRISEDDVKTYARSAVSGAAGSTASLGTAPVQSAPLPDFSKWGATERQPFSNDAIDPASLMPSSKI